jgi:hypothetical protein
MIYTCNVLCYSDDPEMSELLNKEDDGKWLPFAVDLSFIKSIKMTTDDIDHVSFNKTTIHTSDGDTFLTDVDFKTFLKKWETYHNTL